MDLSSPKLLLLQAMASPLGIAVPTNEPTVLRSRLLAARKEDPALSSLKIEPARDDPAAGVWIVRRD